jgi:putative transposase
VSRRKRCSRLGVSPEVRDLIRKMAEANPFWGAPRIHGELGKLGIEVSERTVSRLMPRRRKPPSQTWRAFLGNHVKDLVSVDFFTVPTAKFRVLFVLVVLAHHLTEHPTAAWTAQQMVEAFPEDVAPRYLLRDRGKVYGNEFRRRGRGMHINEVLIAPQSPWQSPFAERLVGSIRGECLDHVVVVGERHLRGILRSYIHYYLQSRTHLSLAKDAPASRSVEPPEIRKVVEFPQVGGLHHRYERRAAWPVELTSVRALPPTRDLAQ